MLNLGLRGGAGIAARWFASSQPVQALVVDDTGFPKDRAASPCVAWQYCGTLGKIGNCQVWGVSVHLLNERTSAAARRRREFSAGLGVQHTATCSGRARPAA